MRYLILKAGRMIRPDSEDPHHKAYVRVRRGKLEQIPQKGAVIKERGEYAPKGTEAKEVMGKDYGKFINDVNRYMSISNTIKEAKQKIEALATEQEEVMSHLRPLFKKFDNVAKEENKFIAEFTAEGFKHKFQSYPRA